ncbi:MAG: MFS transporter, partial [Amphiplicatus sp.]
RTAFHARMLLDRLEWGRVPAIETLGALAGAFEAGGAADPDRAAMKAMGLIVQREAAVLAFGDVLQIVLWVSVASALLLIFVKRNPAPATGAR